MGKVVRIVLAIVVIVVAWKILKGILGLLIGLAIAGVILFGATKLLEGPKR